MGVIEGVSQGVVGELALLQVQQGLDFFVELVSWLPMLAFAFVLCGLSYHLLVYLVLVMTSPRSSVK